MFWEELLIYIFMFVFVYIVGKSEGSFNNMLSNAASIVFRSPVINTYSRIRDALARRRRRFLDKELYRRVKEGKNSGGDNQAESGHSNTYTKNPSEVKAVMSGDFGQVSNNSKSNTKVAPEDKQPQSQDEALSAALAPQGAPILTGSNTEASTPKNQSAKEDSEKGGAKKRKQDKESDDTLKKNVEGLFS